jgi:hypothetical protein
VNITSLYDDWNHSNLRCWKIFRKYLPRYAHICSTEEGNTTNFIYKSSLNAFHDKAKEYASRMTFKKVLLNNKVPPEDVKPHLPGMLDRQVSLALMCMSRLEESNQMKNETFSICLKCKLHLKIMSIAKNQSCRCGKLLDEYGDHCLGCTSNHKTRASNSIRDGLAKVLQRILPPTQLIDSPTQIETEVHNIVPSLPRLKPFDLSIRLDHSLLSGAWRAPYSHIGFDVTLVHSTKTSTSSTSEAAQYDASDLRLRDGERLKFAR